MQIKKQEFKDETRVLKHMRCFYSLNLHHGQQHLHMEKQDLQHVEIISMAMNKRTRIHWNSWNVRKNCCLKHQSGKHCLCNQWNEECTMSRRKWEDKKKNMARMRFDWRSKWMQEIGEFNWQKWTIIKENKWDCD